MRRRGLAWVMTIVVCAPVCAHAAAAAGDTLATAGDQVTYLVPDLKDAGWTVSDGPRQFLHAISVSPAVGQLGDQDLFALRIAYNPNAWLGYEASLGHNAASSLHALIHTFNVLLRYPVPWRVQPYGTVGYGMMTVFPGNAINADPVTKNTVAVGGGLEFYVRDDVALRAEMRAATVFGQELGREDTVAYTYREYTLGFAFYRHLGSTNR